jgi:hypothetical protein
MPLISFPFSFQPKDKTELQAVPEDSAIEFSPSAIEVSFSVLEGNCYQRF